MDRRSQKPLDTSGFNHLSPFSLIGMLQIFAMRIISYEQGAILNLSTGRNAARMRMVWRK